MTAVLDAPPHAETCPVDHDALAPRTAAVGGRKHGAQITYWACPSCPYYFTAITAVPPKKVTMANISNVDQLNVVKALARPTAMGLVIAANPHLTKLQVEAIAADHGYPKINDLRAALVELQSQVDQERMAAAIPTGPSEADQAIERGQRVTRLHQHQEPARPTQQPAPPHHDPTAQLLLEAHDSASKRTVNLAKKIEDLLADLRDRIRDETQARRDAELAAAAKRREAEKAQAERNLAIAEVAKAEAALKAARAKLHRQKGVGRSTTGKPARGTALIREWAIANGHQVSKVGRIPQPIVDAYEAAHPARAAS